MRQTHSKKMPIWSLFAASFSLVLALSFVPISPALADGGGDSGDDVKSMLRKQKRATKRTRVRRRKTAVRRNTPRKSRSTKKVSRGKKATGKAVVNQGSVKRALVRRPAARSSVVAAQAAGTEGPNQGPEFVARELLIRFSDGVSDNQITQISQQFQLRRISDQQSALVGARIFRFGVAAGYSAQRALQLGADPRISAIQPNYLYRLTSDDTVQYALAKLNVVKIHALATGTGVSVGLVDSGIYTGHPALAGIETEQFKAVDYKGATERTHGTAVASLIAGQKQVAGIAPRVKILSARAFVAPKGGGPAHGTTFDLIKALDWTVDRGARILNLSFAGPRDPLVGSALQSAMTSDVVVVAAAGNAGVDAPPAYPAAYDGVIATTATDGRDRLYRSANRGDYISVSAPGVEVFAASGRSGFGFKTGTSMAAAYVSGSVALMLQRRPGLKPAATKKLLESTSRDLGEKGKDQQFGAGLIDTLKALNRFEN